MTQPVPGPARLVDFTDTSEVARWSAIDDVVMGGRSSSGMLPGDQIGIFAGTLFLDRGVGFASVCRCDELVDLSGYDAIELRVRGDGNRYKLNLRTSDDVDGVVYQVGFETEIGSWQTMHLPLALLTPRFRGRSARGTLVPAHVRSVGLLISDRQAGAFRLELSTISATSRPLRCF